MFRAVLCLLILNAFPNVGWAKNRYLEMRRLFLLVDPTFVTEDIVQNNATQPEHRFNQRNFDGTVQPAWQNFNAAYDHLLNRDRPPSITEIATVGFELHRMLLRGNVDGTLDTDVDAGRTRQWDRSRPWHNFIPITDWNSLAPEVRADMERFFVVDQTTSRPNDMRLAHRTEAQLRAVLGDALPASNGRPFADVLIEYIATEAGRLTDPVERAAKIIYLVPRLHPYLNGNGRLSRLWASVELERAGLPVPVGLPMHDWMLSYDQLRLEVQRGVSLGRLWQAYLAQAEAASLPPDRFFQEAYRGSAMEGLILFQPSHSGRQPHIDIGSHQAFLNALAANPGKLPREVDAWAREHAALVHRSLPGFRNAHGGSTVGANEAQRFAFLLGLADTHPPTTAALVAAMSAATLSDPACMRIFRRSDSQGRRS